MENTILYYLFFVLIVLSITIDLFFFKKQRIHFRYTLFQLLFWILLAFGFIVFLYEQKGSVVATKFISGYFLECSLSIDNIFVFLLIFKSWHVSEKSENKALLIGILLAIFLRLLFIYVGIHTMERFTWILYIFGAFLIYTGVKVIRSDKEAHQESNVARYVLKYLRVSDARVSNDRFWMRKNGKIFFTHLGVAIFLLALTDIVFAIDSIPSIIAIVREDVSIPFSSDDILVIYTSNIFAVLSLRPLYFILKKGYHSFPLLSYAIGFILIFIGVSLLLAWIEIHIPHLLSLGIIVGALLLSMLLSVIVLKKKPLQ